MKLLGRFDACLIIASVQLPAKSLPKDFKPGALRVTRRLWPRCAAAPRRSARWTLLHPRPNPRRQPAQYRPRRDGQAVAWISLSRFGHRRMSACATNLWGRGFWCPPYATIVLNCAQTEYALVLLEPQTFGTLVHNSQLLSVLT